MKSIFKNFTTGKLKIFSTACSALMLLQAACIPTHATFNKLMGKLESTRYATVSDIQRIVEENPSFVDDTCGDANIIDFALYEGENSPENRAEIAKYLIQHGAPVTCSDPQHGNSYRWGCDEGLFGFSSWLLRNGWDFDYRDNGEETVAHIAAKYDRADDLAFIMKKAPYLLNALDGMATPLRDAAMFGKYSAAEWLVNHGADLGSGYNSALETARRKGHSDIVKLIERHTKPKATASSSKSGNTALHTAVINGDEAAVSRLLASGADVNVTNKSNYTPLRLAAKTSNITIINLLLQRNADPNAIDDIGNTPLHIAASLGNKDIVDALLKAGADPNIMNNSGGTPLTIAVQKGFVPCVRLMLSHGGDPNLKNSKGKKALDYSSSSEMKALLKDSGGKHGKSIASRAFGKLKSIL